MTGHIVTHPPGRWHLTASVAPPWFRRTPPFQRQGPLSCAREFASWSGSSSTYSNRYVFYVKEVVSLGELPGKGRKGMRGGLEACLGCGPGRGPPLRRRRTSSRSRFWAAGRGTEPALGGCLEGGKAFPSREVEPHNRKPPLPKKRLVAGPRGAYHNHGPNLDRAPAAGHRRRPSCFGRKRGTGPVGSRRPASPGGRDTGGAGLSRKRHQN